MSQKKLLGFLSHLKTLTFFFVSSVVLSFLTIWEAHIFVQGFKSLILSVPDLRNLLGKIF